MNNTYYRYTSYATPSATWTYDSVEQVVTLFWKANANKINYRQGSKHFTEHRDRIISRANTYGIK